MKKPKIDVRMQRANATHIKVYALFAINLRKKAM